MDPRCPLPHSLYLSSNDRLLVFRGSETLENPFKAFQYVPAPEPIFREGSMDGRSEGREVIKKLSIFGPNNYQGWKWRYG